MGKTIVLKSPVRELLLLLILLLFSSLAYAIPIQMEDVELRDFVRWYSDYTGKSIAIDPLTSGTLTVFASDVPEAQIDQFFEGVLAAHGYQLIPGNPLSVMPAGDSQYTGDNFTSHVVTEPPPLKPLVTQLFTFDNVAAIHIEPVIQSFLSARPHRSVSHVVDSINGLLVTSTDKNLQSLMEILPVIDVAHPQLLIQSVIYETLDGDTLDLGLAFGRRSGSEIVGGYNTSSLADTLSSVGGSFGIYDGDILGFTLEAIARNSSATLLSTPQILTLSGTTARISVGQNVPFITGRITGEAADITNPFQTIERRDVGVSLTVTPIVTGSGSVILNVLTQADSLTDSVEASDIITNERTIATTVQIQSGQTIFLGGLVSSDVSESQTAVPILSDIPFLGRLFRSDSSSQQKRFLHVLLQATIITPL